MFECVFSQRKSVLVYCTCAMFVCVCVFLVFLLACVCTWSGTSLTLLVCLFSLCSDFSGTFAGWWVLSPVVKSSEIIVISCRLSVFSVPTWGKHRQNFSEVGGKKVLYDIMGVPSMSDDATLSVLRQLVSDMQNEIEFGWFDLICQSSHNQDASECNSRCCCCEVCVQPVKQK